MNRSWWSGVLLSLGLHGAVVAAGYLLWQLAVSRAGAPAEAGARRTVVAALVPADSIGRSDFTPTQTPVTRAAASPLGPIVERPATAAAPGAAHADSADHAGTADYFTRVRAHLERHRRPLLDVDAAGTARVRFRVLEGGAVGDVALQDRSGDARLDHEALALVQRAAPLPAPPGGAPLQLSVPVEFSD